MRGNDLRSNLRSDLPDRSKLWGEPFVLKQRNEASSEREPGRRRFLTQLGIGVAALAGVSAGLIRWGGKPASPSTREFPGPDSIFHPAQDPRRDPRRAENRN